MNAGSIIGIFVHPAQTARSLAEHPRWVLALILGCMVTAILGWSLIGISSVESVQRMKEGRLGKQMPAEAIEKAEADAQNLTGAQRAVRGLVFPITGYIIFQVLMYAAILHWVARAMGGEGSFSRTWALVAHCRLINPALGGLVALPIMLARQSVFSVSLSLAALFPSLGPGSIVYGILSIFSIFGIWYLVALAAGIQEIHKLPKNLAWITAGIPWLAGGLMQAVQIALF